MSHEDRELNLVVDNESLDIGMKLTYDLSVRRPSGDLRFTSTTMTVVMSEIDFNDLKRLGKFILDTVEEWKKL